MPQLFLQRVFPVALLLMVLVAGAGCGTFGRDWRAASQARVIHDGMEGRWRGRWDSDSNQHGGKLRCLIERQADEKYAARFHAKYKGIFSFHYTALLEARREGNDFRFSGEADLGKLAGGVYSYEGEVSGTNFFARYSSKYDRGTFRMTRP